VTGPLAPRIAWAAAGAMIALLAAPAAPGRLSWLVALALPGAGFVVPDALRARRERRRHRCLVASLPDALDLLAVGTTAGRSPAAGFAEIARSGAGPLAEELGITVAELDCGRPLAEALAQLRNRAPGSEVATLCASIERSRRFGSPLADQLRRQSTALRREQRRAVEERAARAAPKIQLVVALVLVPSVLLMITAGLIANADVLLSGF
jgi:tight adherence protein C